MIDPVAATMGVVTKRLNGPNGLATVLLLLPIVMSAVMVFLQSDKSRRLSGFMQFVVPTDTFMNASAWADFPFWISRKLLMLLVAVPAGASITIACGYASHAVLAAMFGEAGHVSDHQIVAVSVMFIMTMLLAYDVSYYLYHNLQHRIPALWEQHKVHQSAEVMVGTSKDRIHPINDVMNRVWDRLVAGPVYGFQLLFAFDSVDLPFSA